jgi:hypothetical protein
MTENKDNRRPARSERLWWILDELETLSPKELDAALDHIAELTAMRKGQVK